VIALSMAAQTWPASNEAAQPVMHSGALLVPPALPLRRRAVAIVFGPTMRLCGDAIQQVLLMRHPPARHNRVVRNRYNAACNEIDRRAPFRYSATPLEGGATM
jgi:hypothetical protein